MLRPVQYTCSDERIQKLRGDKACSRQPGKRKSTVPFAVFEQPIYPCNLVDGGIADLRKALHQLVDFFPVVTPQAILIVYYLVGQVAQQTGKVGDVILGKAMLSQLQQPLGKIQRVA